MYLYIKNKLLINLLFGFNKYDIDNIVNILFELKGDYDTFFFFNNDYVFLTIYSFFFSYNFMNLNSMSKINTKNLIMSHYLFKSFMFFTYIQYGFNRLLDYLKINKKNYYFKMKELYSISSYFLGYKMSFKGRFTRKQRASSV